MKRERHGIVFFMLLLTAFLPGNFSVYAADGTASEEQMQDSVQGIFGELFTSMGELVSGMTKGMQEGAKNMQSQLDSAGGVEVISDKEKLLALTQTKVLKAEQLEDNCWRVVLAVKNPQEYPVRIADLNAKQQVFLLDQEDFVYEQKETDRRIVTVPERAALKLEFFFPDLDGSTPKILRLYGHDFSVSNVTKKNSEVKNEQVDL